MSALRRHSLVLGAAPLLLGGCAVLTAAAVSGLSLPTAVSTATILPAPTAAMALPAAPQVTSESTMPSVQQSAPPSAPAPVTTQAPAPTGLRIPSLGVEAGMRQLDLRPDGSVEVPPLDDPSSTPGWYRRSPAPGVDGPAIILGHVDSKKYGPGVFFKLTQLKAGDDIEVMRADGSTARFVVQDVRSYAKNDFPTLAVYGNTDYPALRLITCGGYFDPQEHSYTSNTVVFAKMA